MEQAVAIPEVGAVVRGRVVRFFEHSALLDIGNGVKVVLPAGQVSWLNRRPNASEILRIGDELHVVVLGVQQSKKTKTYFFTLGHRQTQANPWEGAGEKHPVGSRAKARVVEFVQFGATVEFESGFRALVPNSEVSWTEKIKPKAEDFLRVGDEIEEIGRAS